MDAWGNKRYAGGSASALSAQLESAVDEMDALRQTGVAEAAALRRQAAEASAVHAAALRALNDRVGRRDEDLHRMHAKLREARGQLVRQGALQSL